MRLQLVPEITSSNYSPIRHTYITTEKALSLWVHLTKYTTHVCISITIGKGLCHYKSQFDRTLPLVNPNSQPNFPQMGSSTKFQNSFWGFLCVLEVVLLCRVVQIKCNIFFLLQLIEQQHMVGPPKNVCFWMLDNVMVICFSFFWFHKIQVCGVLFSCPLSFYSLSFSVVLSALFFCLYLLKANWTIELYNRWYFFFIPNLSPSI